MKIFSLKSKKAFTLVEILVAVTVLTVGILGALLFLVRSMTATGISRDVTVATGYAENIFEEMRGKKTLPEIRQADWIKWAQEQGMNALPGQEITVSFEDRGEHLLGAEVMVSWVREGQPPGKIKLYTEFFR